MAFAGIAERFVDDPRDSRCAGSDGGSESSRSENGRSGASNTLHMSARRLASVLDSCCMRPNGIRVNILGLTPLDFSVNGTDDSIVQWLEREGFEVVSKWAMGSSLDEIRRSAEADVNLVVSAAGYGAARVLYERFGMPYAIGFPAGSELPGLLADQMIINVEKYKEQIENRSFGDPPEQTKSGSFGATFESAEISVDSGIFLDGSAGKDGSTYEKGFVAVIGEGITSLSLAGAIELECGIPAKVLCATECPEGILRECDRMTPDEDDII